MIQFLVSNETLAGCIILSRSQRRLLSIFTTGEVFMKCSGVGLLVVYVVAVVRPCNYTRALRHARKHLTTETSQAQRLQRHLITNRLLQLAAVWRSYCSRREATEISKQCRPGHLSSSADVSALDRYRY